MKICPVCNGVVQGRTDRVYCSTKCKSAKQYEIKTSTETFYKEVDKILKTNRKILKQYNKGGFSTVRKEELLSLGFNPKFFTHYWKNKEGQVYLFCYEYGFLEHIKNRKIKYTIVEWQPYMNKSIS